ncbi:nucleotide sugar dehydrogenase [Candidatus Hydrogenedentota bacterium]
MKISIYGMGYVGVVSGACLVRDGHHVMGVDPVQSKVDDLAKGRTPIREPGVTELLSAGYEAGRLSASSDPGNGVKDADMIWVCVGTPSSLRGRLDLSHVETVVRQIGLAMKKSGARPLVVLRSTVLPGTMNNMVIPTLEKFSGLKADQDFHAVFHPEFLREATAVADFDNPPKVIVGENTPGAGDLLMSIYESFVAPKYCVSLGEAEMLKYCDNLFHALKVTFANEVGAIAHSAGIDARRVAEMFCSDTKLNISPCYLRPGFAFGGSCLPKDLRAILRYATIHSIPTPMLRSILESNKAQVEAFVVRVCAYYPKTVGLVGLAFKANTDDMRESPYVEIAKRLIGEGIAVRIYDPSVQTDNLVGANKVMVEVALGHLRELLVDSLDDLDESDVILINHATVDAARVEKWINAGTHTIDLANIEGVSRDAAAYEGIAW